MTGHHETYTHGHPPMVVAAHAARTVEDSAAYLAPHLSAGADLLDLGCGPGSITVGLARLVAPGRVVGIDAAAGVLDQARELAADAGVEVDFQVAEVYDLRFPDAAFDVVHAHQLLHHLGDPVAALGEVRRVLRPNGVLGVRDMDFGTFVFHPSDEALDSWQRTYEAVHRANGGDPRAGRKLLGWVLAAGFTDPVATSSTWTFADADRRRWWGELWAGRTVSDPFAARAVELGFGDMATLDEFAAAFRNWAEQPDGWSALIHGEVVARRPTAP
jgi:SAM-dependent methyltransferase